MKKLLVGLTLISCSFNLIAQSSYEKWIAPYRTNSAANKYSIGNQPDEFLPKVIISVVSEKTGNKSQTFGVGKETSGAKIFNDGKVDYFFHYSLGSKGSCCGQIEKDELSRIDTLLSKLPSDKSILPPTGRRVIFQIPQKDKFKVRVYDLADAPDEVLELLRLTHTGIGSSILRIESETKWEVSKPHNNFGIAVTSNGRQIISSELNGSINIWQTETKNQLEEVVKPYNLAFNGIILSPDDSIAVIEGWGTIGIFNTQTWKDYKILEEPIIGRKRFQLSKPHFIKNGKFLVLESSQPTLHIYDTATWQKTLLPEIPVNAISYYPAQNKNRVIYGDNNGQIFLRDIQKGKDLIKIDKAKLADVSFSPDESVFAVITTNHERDKRINYRIRLFQSDSGKFIKEFLPFERDVCESVEGLLWSADGNYFLAATKPNTFASNRSISIWNVKSGRHRAELSTCVGTIRGFSFLSDKNKIAVGCSNGFILTWDLENALNKIKDFEKDLKNK